MAKVTYLVKRRHVGDKEYHPGETREANEADVRHLIGKALVPMEGKQEKAPENKKADAPSNKGAAMPGLPAAKK